MKIVSIFGETKRNLLAIHFKGQKDNEFKKAFKQWSDVNYLRNFFKEHQDDLQNGYYNWSNVNSAVLHTMDLADKLETLIRETAYKETSEISEMLQSIFKPLNNNDLSVETLQESKTSKHWLRIYAIRLDKHCYIITGSAIKLVKTMEEKKHLWDELIKLEKVKNYLEENGILDVTDVEYIELKN